MIITPARPEDLEHILAMREEAAKWLGSLGTDQWSKPFPDEETQTARLRDGIEQGETWMVRDGADTIGSITINRNSNPLLWTPSEQQEPALYAHKMSVRRSRAGSDVGGRMLDWASDQAARQGLRWLRLDAWTTNKRLHQYYMRHGFDHVRTVVRDDYPSGALFQRPAQPWPDEALDLLLTEAL